MYAESWSAISSDPVPTRCSYGVVASWFNAPNNSVGISLPANAVADRVTARAAALAISADSWVRD